MTFTNFKDIAESRNQVITISHVATTNEVSFPAFLTEYSDNYSVSWGTEQVFGRADPVKPYQSTGRQIQIGFDVLSPSFEAARENMAKYTVLTKMLYPVYSQPLSEAASITSRGRTVVGPPLLRVKFVNFIQSADGSGSLLGCIEGVNFAPNRDPGFFSAANGEIFPKLFNISFRFTPQHESVLGWDSVTKQFITPTFPYSADSITAGTSTRRSSTRALNGGSE